MDVPLHVPEWGNPNGPPILFVHGWSQAHQSWAHQLGGVLDQFRLIAPDLRGHGMSGKPEASGHYNAPEPWAADIANIIATLGLDQPYLVGWSMGGWVVQDYLSHYGDTGISGVALVGTSITTGNYMPSVSRQTRLADTAVAAQGMNSDDLSENLEATIAFLGICTAKPLPAKDLAAMTAINMACPPAVRRASRGRSEDYRESIARVSKPITVLWGAHEKLALPAMIDECRAYLPKAKFIEYANSGHAPFWEEPDQFNADLTRLVTEARA